MKKAPKKAPVGHIEFSIAKDAPSAVRVTLSDSTKDEVIVLEKGGKSLAIGIGKKPTSHRKFILLARKIVALARSHRIAHLSIALTDLLSVVTVEAITPEERVEIFVREAEMANFDFITYKKTPEEGWAFVESVVITHAEGREKATEQAIVRAQTVAYAVNTARTLSNIPGGEMTPEVLADKAKEFTQGTGITLKVLGVPEMKKLGMGGVLGVGQGSDSPPRFIILEYKKGGAKEKPIILVGKGITFDTGGLNLKPTNAIHEMHMDMSGGAAVIASIVAAAQLGLKKNIIGLIPAAENMPSGASYRPGDILRTMSGITIEVTNTDAEGRVVLSDALTYAERYDPRLVVDVATLTGSAMGALGLRASAIFSKDEAIIAKLRELGETSGDYVWPLPLWDEYEKEIKGTFGDIVNSGPSRYGGAIEGAIFLYQFAKKYPWAHIDMAPRMTATPDEHLAKGAAGAPVRLLIKLLETY